ELRKSIQKRFEVGPKFQIALGRLKVHADMAHPISGLDVRGKRPRRCPADVCDEVASSHWPSPRPGENIAPIQPSIRKKGATSALGHVRTAPYPDAFLKKRHL